MQTRSEWKVPRAFALTGSLVFALLMGCSGSKQSEPLAVYHRPVPEPTARPATILADWFEDLPCPMPAPLPFVEGSQTLVVLPDTQVYTDLYPEVFEQQTRWVADHRDERDIRFLLHVGDITERASEREWRSAVSAMGWLDDAVPYALAAGNHDYGTRGRAENRSTLLNTYFPVAKQRKMATFGGTYRPGQVDNSYHLFSAGGRDWIAVVLEWGPRPAVMGWANRILRTHKDRTAIVVTHAYLFFDDSRYDRHRDDQPWNPHHYATAQLPGGVSDGEELWEGLISRHGNVAMVLSGHVLGDGVGYLASTGRAGNTVHQMLANYQMLPGGGRGYLRLLELLPDGKTVQVKTYSPLLDDYLTSARQQFVLEIDVRLGVSCVEGICEPEAEPEAS
jgi:3',5'-cyclic AMP phosphodiesterase CpdA